MPSVYNITAQTVLKAGAGKLKRYAIVVAGAAGTLNDAATAGAAGAANAMVATPASVLVQDLGNGWQFANGLVASPGAGQTLSVDFE